MPETARGIRIVIEIDTPIIGNVSVNAEQINVPVAGPIIDLLDVGINYPPASAAVPVQESTAGSGSGALCVRGSTGGHAGEAIFVALDLADPQHAPIPPTPFAITEEGGGWKGLLNGVSCGTIAYPISHMVAAWRVVGSNTPEGPVVIPFSTFASTSYDPGCAHAESLQPVGIPVAWPAYRLHATGFSKNLSKLNSDFNVKLCLKQSNAATLVWTGIDATKSDGQVKLVLHRLNSPHWELEYVLGDSQFVYSKSLAEWNAIGANVFADFRIVSGNEAPAHSIQVHPII
jgi:hypothetical protein